MRTERIGSIWETSMKCLRLAAFLFLAVFPASRCAAGWGGSLLVAVELFDNFLQAPAGRPETDVVATTVKLDLQGVLDPSIHLLQAFVSVDGTAYSKFDSSAGVGGGIRYDGNPHAFMARVGYFKDRPRFDIGDTFDRASGVETLGRYSYRITPDWQVGAETGFIRETYAFTGTKNNSYKRLGGSVRYRGFGYAFSPEVGVTRGWMDTKDNNDDYDQSGVYLQVRSMPVEALYLTGRYRYRTRDYTIEQDTASNLDRKDTRHLFTMAADIQEGENITWVLYYAYQDADSTKESRVFTTHFVSAGLRISF